MVPVPVFTEEPCSSVAVSAQMDPGCASARMVATDP